MEVFRNCILCGKNVPSDLSVLSVQGTSPTVHQYCECNGMRPSVWRGQNYLFDGSRRFDGDVRLITSAYSSGLGYSVIDLHLYTLITDRIQKLRSLFEFARISLFSAPTFYKIAKYSQQCVQGIYEDYQEIWIDTIKNAYKVGVAS